MTLPIFLKPFTATFDGTEKLSPSGLATLLVLILIGPIIYTIKHYCYDKPKLKNRRLESPTTNEEESGVEDDEESELEKATQDNGGEYSSSLKSDKDDSYVLPPKHEENPEFRETYGNMEYLFAMIGYAIGIGNVWRFPYVIAQNGGSAALVAYLVCLFLVALPLYQYEMIIGQFTRLSTIPCFEYIRPRWKTLGIASFFMLFIAESYFTMVIAYTVPYIFNSLWDPLPWAAEGANAAEFWFSTVLNQYPDIHDRPEGTSTGPIQLNLVLSLIFVWAITYFSTVYGKKILSKITYVTVLLPIVLMLILVGRTVVLPGASDGIKFYIGKFEASELADLTVWATACSQILFSLGPGFGTAITLSSYTNKKEDVVKACWITALSNSAFSIIGGFAVFSMVGHLAYQEGLDVEDVATRSGTGLAFITIAEAMQYFGSFANVMSVLFFVMLFLLGLDSSYAWLETLVCNVEDYLFVNDAKRKKENTWKITTVIVLLQLGLGLVYTTRLGNEILDVVDHYVGIIFLLIVVSFEALMINLDFGFKRLEYAVRIATGRKGLSPKWICIFDLRVTVPIIPFLMAINSIVEDARSPYGDYPTSLLAWGWALLGLLLCILPMTFWKTAPGMLAPLPKEGDDDEKEVNDVTSDNDYITNEPMTEVEEHPEAPSA